MKKPDARSRILNKAASLFQRRGYSEVGINEIIDCSGTAKATFYHHFPSKRSLCEAWLGEMHERSKEQRRQLLESDADAASKVEVYFGQLAQYLEANQFRGCPYTNTAAVAGDERELVQCIRDHKASIRGFFHCLTRAMIGDEGRADRLGDTLFLLYSGAATEAQNLGEIWPVEAAQQAAVDLCRQQRD